MGFSLIQATQSAVLYVDLMSLMFPSALTPACPIRRRQRLGLGLLVVGKLTNQWLARGLRRRFHFLTGTVFASALAFGRYSERFGGNEDIL